MPYRHKPLVGGASSCRQEDAGRRLLAIAAQHRRTPAVVSHAVGRAAAHDMPSMRARAPISCAGMPMGIFTMR